LKKEKATRTFIEMLQWNILGEPDSHNAEPYANALLRKAINSKDVKADKKVFEKIFKKALVDYENAVTISSDEARDVIKAITK
jgi:F0F1-type ATP synthase delta subunit